MATVRAIATDALIEIGVLEPGDAMDAQQGALALTRFQKQIDAWAANKLALSLQARNSFTLTSGTSTVTIGASGATWTMARPDSLNTVTYIIPSTTPTTEVLIGQMDEDTYASLSIKGLSSSLPTLCFYQINLSNANGSLFFWPQVTQNVDIVLYSPQGIGVPTSLNTDVIGPSGYQEAFLYQLALRLCRPFGVAVSQDLVQLAANAWTTMTRPNTKPGLLGTDPALTAWSSTSTYNVLSDTGG